MPPQIPTPTAPSPDTDNEIIIAILEDIKIFLRHCVDRVLPIAIQDGFEDRIQYFKAELNNIDQTIENAKTAIRGLQNTMLDSVGMSGPQLREIKRPILVRIMLGAYKAYNRLPEGVHKVVKATLKALGVINRFLGSLVKLVSSLEIVKEFKEALESIL